MWTFIIIWLLVVALMSTLLIHRSRWKLNNPNYQEREADRYVAEKRASRDRRNFDKGNKPERRVGDRPGT